MGLSLTAAGFDYVAYYNGAYENANSLDALEATGANSIELRSTTASIPQTIQVYADPNYTDSLPRSARRSAKRPVSACWSWSARSSISSTRRHDRHAL